MVGGTTPPRLVVVDATGYLFRSFHAIRDLRTREGQPTNAVYGMANTLALLRENEPGAAIVCVMDAPGPTFRHELYPEYKANRKKTDPDLIAQIAPTKELIEALGMPLYCVAGVEADDVIATLALQAIAAKRDCKVATSDKDLMYLAATGCRILDPNRKVELDAAGVEAKYGVKAAQMLDYLSLVGDAADNIPGVPGVGAKTAAKWLSEYGSLEGIIEARATIKGKVGENLCAGLEQLRLSRQLVALREDIELDDHPNLVAPPEPQGKLLRALGTKLRFNDNLVQRLARVHVAPVPVAPVPVEFLLTAAQIKQAGQKLSALVKLGIHVELSGPDAPSAALVAVALHTGTDAYYLPLAHARDPKAAKAAKDAAPTAAAEPVVPAAEISNADQQAAQLLLAQLVTADDCELRLFGAKEALHAFTNLGLTPSARIIDVGLLAFCENSGDGLSPAAIARRFLDHQVPEVSALIGGREKPKQFAWVEPSVAAATACQWAHTALTARELITEKMGTTKLTLFRQVENPAMAPLLAMERNGICLDSEQLGVLDTEFVAKMAQLRAQITPAGDAEFNPNSPKQVSELLYDKLKLDAGRKTRQGERSTNETELERLARTTDSPVPQLILDYRHVAKLSGTYTAALPTSINPTTGRVHTQFIQTGAITGRLASKNPNLQNIPIRSTDGHRIRRCFVAPPGRVLVAADYSQIELRILAHFSGDATLLASFAEGEDVHRRTAAELNGVAPAAVDDEMRRFAKTINFGLIYGMGPHGLATRLNIRQKEAKEIIATYFARLPGVRDYLDSLRKQASSTNAVQTLHGREISFASRGHGHTAVSAAQRAATNAPMQGTAADLMKLAMTAVHEELAANFPDALLLLQVHDELLVEIPTAQAAQLGTWLSAVMSNVAQLRVPLTVEVGSGTNWDEAH